MSINSAWPAAMFLLSARDIRQAFLPVEETINALIHKYIKENTVLGSNMYPNNTDREERENMRRGLTAREDDTEKVTLE